MSSGEGKNWNEDWPRLWSVGEVEVCTERGAGLKSGAGKGGNGVVSSANIIDSWESSASLRRETSVWSVWGEKSLCRIVWQRFLGCNCIGGETSRCLDRTSLRMDGEDSEQLEPGVKAGWRGDVGDLAWGAGGGVAVGLCKGREGQLQATNSASGSEEGLLSSEASIIKTLVHPVPRSPAPPHNCFVLWLPQASNSRIIQ